MKMREAIKALLDVMYDLGIDEETVAIASESTNCHMNSHKILETIRNAKSALAEPPRNCDRFDTGDVKMDAQHAMEAILEEGVAGYRGIAEYLLSPAKEA